MIDNTICLTAECECDRTHRDLTPGPGPDEAHMLAAQDGVGITAGPHGCTCGASKPEHVHADTCEAWVDCPDCNGTGEVADYWNGYVGCYETKRCPSCNGEAWLPVLAYVGLMEGRCPHSVPLDYDCTDCAREVAAARASGALTVRGGWGQPTPF